MHSSEHFSIRPTRTAFSTFTTCILLALLCALPAGLAAQSFPVEHLELLSSASYQSVLGTLGIDPDRDPVFLSPSAAGPPLPRVGPNVEVTDPQLPEPDGQLGRSETTLATALGGRVVIAGWNDADGLCGPPWNQPCTPPPTPGLSGYGVSLDGGRTWDDRGAPFVGTRIALGPGTAGVSATGRYVTSGDPSLDSAGPEGRTVYYANLARFEDFPLTTAGLSVHVGSVDSAGRFSLDQALLLQSPDFPHDFLDKEHVAADRRPGSGLVTLAAVNFKRVGGRDFAGHGQIESYSSADGGATWGRSIIQPDETVTVSPLTGAVNQGPEPVVAPDGTLYVAWLRGFLSPFFGQGALGVWPEIRFARSDDGGSTWTPAAAGTPGLGLDPAGTVVARACSGDLFPPSGYNRNRSNTWPRIAVARSGPHAGRIYVTWQDCRIANGGVMPAPLGPEDGPVLDLGHPDTDVYLAFSDDGGASWSEPVLAAGGGDGLLQFWPTVSVASTGAVDLTYYESFEPSGTVLFGGSGTSLVDVGWVRSVGGGERFGEPVRVTTQTSDWAAAATDIRPNFGDYNDAATVGQDLLVTWGDGRTGVPAVFFARGRDRSAGGAGRP